MKIATFAPYALVFISGFAIAWLIRPVAKTPPLVVSENTEPGSSRPRVTKTERANGASTTRTQDLLKKLSDATYNEKKTSDLMAEIDTSEFPALVESLTLNAGITGLDYKNRAKLETLLVGWSSRDPDAAIAWAAVLRNPQDRKAFLNDIIDGICNKDPEKALELTRNHCRDEEGNWDVPYQVAQSIVSMEPDAMLDAVKSLLSSNNSSGQEGTFPSDYDFRKALDGLAEIKSSLKSGQRIALYPSNLLTEWTRRDPSASWKWISEGEQVSSDDVEDFLETYCASADVASAAQMMVSAGERFKSPDAHYRAAFSVLTEKQSPELLQQFLSLMPGDRMTHLAELFGPTRYSSGGKFDRMKDLVLSQMEDTERMTILEASFKNGCSERDRQIYEPILRKLGHGDGEIQRMLPPKPEGE
jgi:hypothetical protein